MNQQIAELFAKLAELEKHPDGAILFVVTKGPRSGIKASTITATAKEIDELGLALTCVQGMAKNRKH